MSEVSEGVESPPADSETTALVEIPQLIRFVKRCVNVLLEDNDIFPPSLESALNDRQNHEYLRKFISDPQTKTLLIQKSSVNKG